jgi:aminoglycoside phosphotransferase (APT) family kinase protein
VSSSAAVIVKDAAQRAGLVPGPAELLRDGSHALFRLPSGIVARVGAPGSGARASHEIQIAAWLATSAVAAVQPVVGVPQPTLIGDRPVTWWQELPPHRAATPTELGAVLRALHRLPAPTGFNLPRLDPFREFAERIDAAESTPQGDRRWLADHLLGLLDRWNRLPPGRPHCVVHGDAWQGNVAVPDDGGPILMDLEHVALGPPEWDLINVAVDRTDFDRIGTKDYRAFVEAYGGYDVTTWPGYRTLADIIELRWVCFAISKADRDRAAGAEARHRIACLRGEIPRPWTWTAL